MSYEYILKNNYKKSISQKLIDFSFWSLYFVEHKYYYFMDIGELEDILSKADKNNFIIRFDINGSNVSWTYNSLTRTLYRFLLKNSGVEKESVSISDYKSMYIKNGFIYLRKSKDYPKDPYDTDDYYSWNELLILKPLKVDEIK